MLVAAQRRKQYNREYYLRNKERMDLYSLEWGDKQRSKVIALLGGKCAACGISDPDVLAVDHVMNGGCQERRKYQNQRTIFAKILRDGKTGKYQLLCHNCNWKKRLLETRRAKQNSKTAQIL